jgi:putative transposase
VEDLRVRGMTASAKGTVEQPGTNAKQNAGLNRSILQTGWGNLRRMPEYKAVHVVAVNPAYSSQTAMRADT